MKTMNYIIDEQGNIRLTSRMIDAYIDDMKEIK